MHNIVEQVQQLVQDTHFTCFTHRLPLFIIISPVLIHLFHQSFFGNMNSKYNPMGMTTEKKPNYNPRGGFIEFIFSKKLWWKKCIKTGEMLIIHGNLCVKHVKWISCISCSTCSTILCMLYLSFVLLRRSIRWQVENWEIFISDFYPMGLYLEF